MSGRSRSCSASAMLGLVDHMNSPEASNVTAHEITPTPNEVEGVPGIAPTAERNPQSAAKIVKRLLART